MSTSIKNLMEGSFLVNISLFKDQVAKCYKWYNSMGIFVINLKINDQTIGLPKKSIMFYLSRQSLAAYNI